MLRIDNLNYVGQEKTKSNFFLALIASKKHITCRIRVDPAKFKDEEKRTRELKGWFFKGLRGVEKAFKIASATDIDQTMPLIRQSYENMKWLDSA